MQSDCTVVQLLCLCMCLRYPKCSHMAKRLGKSEVVAITNTIFQTARQPLGSTMWTFILLHSVYLAMCVVEASTSPKPCPGICECLGVIVKCNQQDLTRLPKGIPNDVTILDLSGNNISSINNNGFLQFPKLLELNLRYNKVDNVFLLGKFPKSLHRLYLNGNKLQTLSGNWNQFTKLDLSDNRITRINNDSFGNNSVLIELNLNHNEITTIDLKALKSLPSLQILKLKGNRLTSMPKLDLQALKILDLSQNKLDTIPSLKLGDMTPQLEDLKLSHNMIDSFNTGTFYGLDKLKKLYLDGNLLSNVNVDWMFDIKLVHLYLQNNRITNVSSESWDYCYKTLKVLNLANNNLRNVLVDHVHGRRFAKLQSLESLNLSSNGIFEISDNSFQRLNKLQELDLSNNKLSWTAYDSNGTFKGLYNLKKLNLSNNEITCVVKVMFEELPAIETLDLRNNRIQEVTKNAFKPMRSLVDLRMNTDDLYCGCKLIWFSRWLSGKRQLAQSLPLKCGQPKKLSGQDFLSIATKDLVCDSTSRPEIIEHPKTQTTFKGHNVRFSCTVKNGSIDGIKISWKKDTKNIDISHSKLMKYTQVTDNNFVIYKSVLHLSNVTKSRDNGVYQCVVVTRVGEMKSRKARLEVFVPPKFKSKPGDLVTRLGGTVRFNCSASGDPQPQIYFRKDTDSISLKLRLNVDEDTFIIENITVEDVGLYRCFARSRAGIINATFQINIVGKPVSLRPMLDKICLLNDSVIFACVTRAWPLPTFTWMKDGNIVDLTSRNIKEHREGNTDYLVIISVGYSDAGVYKCVMVNSLGHSHLTSHLEVVEDLSRENTKSPPATNGIDHRTFVVALVFTASFTMVITTLVCIFVIHAISRRRSRTFYTTKCYQQHDNALDSYSGPTTNCDAQEEEYMQMTETTPSESPRSSSTFVTSSSQTPSDSNFAQTSSSDSGSTKENQEGSFDGRHSSGVCSMNSSTSSLASTTNHRNTYPFSNNSKKFPYPGGGGPTTTTTACLYDASDDNTSCVLRGDHGLSRRTLLFKYNEQPPSSSRRKHKSRERHVNNRKKGVETERLYNKPSGGGHKTEDMTEEYETEPNTSTVIVKP